VTLQYPVPFVATGMDLGVERRRRLEEEADRHIEWAMQELGGIP